MNYRKGDYDMNGLSLNSLLDNVTGKITDKVKSAAMTNLNDPQLKATAIGFGKEMINSQKHIIYPALFLLAGFVVVGSMNIIMGAYALSSKGK